MTYGGRPFDTRPLQWSDFGYQTDEDTHLAPLAPMGTTRVAQNDDHHAQFTSSFGLTVTPKLSAGVDLGPLEVRVSLEGSINGTASQRHDLRDSLNLQNWALNQAWNNGYVAFFHPYGDVAVRPVTDASLTLGLLLNLRIRVDVYFGMITVVNTDLVNTNTTLANWSSENGNAWGEDSTLRMAYSDDSSEYTGAASASMKQPSQATSHNVGGGLYKPFLDYSVDNCLADPPPPAGGDTCAARPDTPETVPNAELCFWDNTPTRGFCSTSIATYVSGAYPAYTAAQKTCMTSYYQYLCSPFSQEQYYQNHTVVAHKLPDTFNDANDADTLAFKALVDQCAQAFAHDQASAELWALSFFKVAACTDEGMLVGPAQFITPESPNSAPIPTAGGTAQNCQ